MIKLNWAFGNVLLRVFFYTFFREHLNVLLFFCKDFSFVDLNSKDS